MLYSYWGGKGYFYIGIVNFFFLIKNNCVVYFLIYMWIIRINCVCLFYNLDVLFYSLRGYMWVISLKFVKVLIIFVYNF